MMRLILSGFERTVEWHAGDPLPECVKDPQKRGAVLNLQADEHELLLLLACLAEFIPVPFTDIPAQTARRTGEYARYPEPPPFSIAIQKTLAAILHEAQETNEKLRIFVENMKGKQL